jgi:hypothetical protein
MSVLARIQHVAAAVARPRLFGVAELLGLFLAQAHRLDLLLAHAQQQQHALHALGAALAERDVVLAAAALVGVALDQHLQLGVPTQVRGMRLDQGLELVPDVVAVEVVVHRALRQHVRRVAVR